MGLVFSRAQHAKTLKPFITQTKVFGELATGLKIIFHKGNYVQESSMGLRSNGVSISRRGVTEIPFLQAELIAIPF